MSNVRNKIMNLESKWEETVCPTVLTKWKEQQWMQMREKEQTINWTEKKQEWMREQTMSAQEKEQTVNAEKTEQHWMPREQQHMPKRENNTNANRRERERKGNDNRWDERHHWDRISHKCWEDNIASLPSFCPSSFCATASFMVTLRSIKKIHTNLFLGTTIYKNEAFEPLYGHRGLHTHPCLHAFCLRTVRSRTCGSRPESSVRLQKCLLCTQPSEAPLIITRLRSWVTVRNIFSTTINWHTSLWTPTLHKERSNQSSIWSLRPSHAPWSSRTGPLMNHSHQPFPTNMLGCSFFLLSLWWIFNKVILQTALVALICVDLRARSVRLFSVTHEAT